MDVINFAIRNNFTPRTFTVRHEHTRFLGDDQGVAKVVVSLVLLGISTAGVGLGFDR